MGREIRIITNINSGQKAILRVQKRQAELIAIKRKVLHILISEIIII